MKVDQQVYRFYACLAFLCILSSFTITTDALWSKCPRKCKCHSSWIRGVTTVEVDCSEGNLLKIPTVRDGMPRDVTKLVLFKNYIQEIPRNAFRSFRYLKEIYLYENFITTVDKDAFNGLRRLKTLSLHHNRLTKLQNGTFRELSQLQSLHLYANFLEEINDATFTGLRRLTTLSLHENHLRHIPRNSFHALKELLFLSLYRNHLTELKSGIFCQNSRLLQLYLAQNRIARIDDDSFRHCTSMVKLSLGYNRLTNISSFSFNGLFNLEELFLNNNNIKSFPNDAFTQLRGLKKLSLASNKLASIEKGAFDGLINVIELSLSGNLLSELTPRGFEGLDKLRILTLQENNIAKIRKDSFLGLRNLVTLYLYRNRLSNIPSRAFMGLHKLMELNLGVNRIASIDNEAFAGLPMLVSLSLNSNHLSLILGHVFKGLSVLQKLTLYFNQIRYVAEDAFSPLKGLNVLSWNPPTTLIRFHPKLQTIQSNILHCDCNALWLQAWLKNRTALASSKISCASPETFKGKELLQVKETAFPCDPLQVQVIPSSAIVLEGGGTSFKCSVLPGAIYTWVHNGMKIDLQQSGDKYTVQQNGLLEINEVSKENAGTYICLAENKAGVSAASAELSIGSAPDIIKYPKEETVVHIPKTSVVLPCRAEGYPKPKISWVKSDAMLQFDNNVFMAHDGSLVILSMQYENEGIYSCVAGNIFGKKVVTQKLYLGQGSMCLPSCRRDAGYCIAKYECQCLPDFSGPACETRKNSVDDIQDTQVELNNTITGKSALLEKPSSWVYEPLEMDLEDISGGGDTEEDSDEANVESVSPTKIEDADEQRNEDDKIRLIIQDHKPPASAAKETTEEATESPRADKASQKKGLLISRRIPQSNRIARSSILRALTTKLLVVANNDQSKLKTIDGQSSG